MTTSEAELREGKEADFLPERRKKRDPERTLEEEKKRSLKFSCLAAAFPPFERWYLLSFCRIVQIKEEEDFFSLLRKVKKYRKGKGVNG